MHRNIKGIGSDFGKFPEQGRLYNSSKSSCSIHERNKGHKEIIEVIMMKKKKLASLKEICQPRDFKKSARPHKLIIK